MKCNNSFFVNIVLLVKYALFATSLSACARQIQSQEAIQALGDKGIVNGQRVTHITKLSARVVHVLFFDPHTGKASGCTGSLLPNNIVLTAAHCLEVGQKFAIGFGTKFSDQDDWAEAYSNHPVIAVKYIPGFHSRDALFKADNDLGLIKFKGKIPVGYEPFPEPTGTEIVDLKNVRTFHMIGYGQTSYFSKYDGTLRTTSLSASNINPNGETVYPFSRFLETALIVSQPTTGVCSGDSGSPLVAYVNDQPKLVGVATSAGNYANLQGEQCSGSATFIRIDKHIHWLKRTYEILKSRSDD